jgi:hypothetical protein
MWPASAGDRAATGAVDGSTETWSLSSTGKLVSAGAASGLA